jgi:peptidylprolyl isomerase
MGMTVALIACTALALGACGEDEASSDKAGGAEKAVSAEEAAGFDVVDETGGKKSGNGANRPKPKVKVPNAPPPKKLVAIEMIEGTGEEALVGRDLTVQYVGVKYKNGEEFESYWRPGGTVGRPVTFTLGRGIPPPGWDIGLQGMKVGGRRELILPSRLAYGPEGFLPAVGPNETLIYLFDLVRVR